MEKDTEKWESEIQNKSTLSLYRRFKTEIKEEKIYDNRYSYRLLFCARSNTLDVNDGSWNRGNEGGDLGPYSRTKLSLNLSFDLRPIPYSCS